MHRRGLTMVETIVAIAAAGVVLVAAVILLAPTSPDRRSNRQLKDASQVRGIHQAMVIWAQNNADEYPLPSRFDLQNATVPEEGRAKDTTANILSLLVFNGLITTEMLHSPAEVNRSIRIMENYEYDLPRRALRPAEALWDPGLSADFTAEGGGHISYAHLPPAEGRLARWDFTFIATEAVLGMRGPEITMLSQERGRTAATLANTNSHTLRMAWNRDRTTRQGWAGNVVFNDNHTVWHEALTAGTYTNAAGQTTADYLHYDEPDDPQGLNNYLGIFIRAGERREDFKAIWD